MPNWDFEYNLSTLDPTESLHLIDRGEAIYVIFNVRSIAVNKVNGVDVSQTFPRNVCTCLITPREGRV
jgi:hypothetical protein